MKKGVLLLLLLLLILFFILCSCSSPARYKVKNDIIIYENNEYFDTNFYVSEKGAICLNGELKLIGVYPCELAFFLPKPIYKLSNDDTNGFLFVSGVGFPLYIYSKEPFVAPDNSNFYLSRIENDDFCILFENGETFLDIFKSNDSIKLVELEIRKEYDCKAYSSNYSFILLNINIIVDNDGNVYISSFETDELYLLKDEYFNFELSSEF